MATTKRDRLIADLELMAAGANGGPVVIDENNDRPTIVHCLGLEPFARFYSAVSEQWFPNMSYSDLLGPFAGMWALPDWTDFETLADAIIKEQKRVAAVAKDRA